MRRLLLEVGDPGDVGALAGLELDRQLLLDDLVGDVVEDDVDAGIVGHEALEQVLDDRALDAVGVPHHPDVAGEARWPEAEAARSSAAVVGSRASVPSSPSFSSAAANLLPGAGEGPVVRVEPCGLRR